MYFKLYIIEFFFKSYIFFIIVSHFIRITKLENQFDDRKNKFWVCL